MALKLLPPGFRFHPTDVELVMYYLKRKIMGKKLHFEAITEVNIYQFSPWDLPDKSCLKCKDLEWYFFCPREKKYATGIRVKRATENGYWKTTGKDRSIRHNDQIVGTVKTLVFHLGHAPKGERTDWVIYEYKILDDNLAAEGLQDAYALCKLFKKNGLGPKNGAQYGAPFNEADWADDDDTKNHAISFASEGPSWNMPRQTEEGTIESSQFPPGNTSGLPVLLEGPSPSAGVVVADVTDNDIVRLLDSFTDEDMLIPEENGIEQDGLIGSTEIVPIPCGDGHDIYNGLGDLDSWGWMNGETFDLSGLQDDEAFPSNTFDLDNSTYIELDDLLSPLEFCNGVNGADQMCGNPSHGNMQQLYTRTSSSGTSFEHASCLNELPVPPKGSYEGNGCVDVDQMVDPQIYRGSNRSNGISFTREQLEDVGYSSKMERGSQLLYCYPRIMERNPAHHLPTAAEHLALTYSRCYGGSSIHIKAEVTHGAGECTNEALSVMMGGSGSCWSYWEVFPRLLLLLLNYLLYLVEFCLQLICCLSETVPWSDHYNCHHQNKDFVIMFSLTNTIHNLINSILNICTFTNCLTNRLLKHFFFLLLQHWCFNVISTFLSIYSFFIKIDLS